MPLNPLAFDSQESFEKALMEEGLKRGWVPFLTNTENAIKHVLFHHGVKGMRWGVRRKATVGAQEVVISDRRKKIKTSGGAGHPAHPDAVSARTVGQIARKSGPKALSNAELRAYNERLNLEQNYKRLKYQDSSLGKKFALTVLKQKGPSTVENVGKAAVGSSFVKKRMAVGAAALAFG